MKKLIFSLLLITTSIVGKGQAHIGSTEAEIRAMEPTNQFSSGYLKTTDGETLKYISSYFALGQFFYYFKDGKSKFCTQFPDDIPSLNAQVEIYNSKYVRINPNKWQAYLDKGGRMEIILDYDAKRDLYMFIYYSIVN